MIPKSSTFFQNLGHSASKESRGGCEALSYENGDWWMCWCWFCLLVCSYVCLVFVCCVFLFVHLMSACVWCLSVCQVSLLVVWCLFGVCLVVRCLCWRLFGRQVSVWSSGVSVGRLVVWGDICFLSSLSGVCLVSVWRFLSACSSSGAYLLMLMCQNST